MRRLCSSVSRFLKKKNNVAEKRTIDEEKKKELLLTGFIQSFIIKNYRDTRSVLTTNGQKEDRWKCLGKDTQQGRFFECIIIISKETKLTFVNSYFSFIESRTFFVNKKLRKRKLVFWNCSAL